MISICAWLEASITLTDPVGCVRNFVCRARSDNTHVLWQRLPIESNADDVLARERSSQGDGIVSSRAPVLDESLDILRITIDTLIAT